MVKNADCTAQFGRMSLRKLKNFVLISILTYPPAKKVDITAKATNIKLQMERTEITISMLVPKVSLNAYEHSSTKKISCKNVMENMLKIDCRI